MFIEDNVHRECGGGVYIYDDDDVNDLQSCCFNPLGPIR